MSTRVGTLQAPRAGGSILLAAFLASFVVLTIAMVAISVDQGRQGETTFVGRHLVSTPSELSAGIVGGAEQTFVGGRGRVAPSEISGGIVGGLVGGTAANTPSELSGWSSPPASRRKVHESDTLGTNTPTELSGGIRHKFAHQRG
ncbi:MAG: hypothetical protein WB297_14345 [Actinomycetota bacterium]